MRDQLKLRLRILPRDATLVIGAWCFRRLARAPVCKAQVPAGTYSEEGATENFRVILD